MLTDIGAGSVCSIIDAMRSALAVSINKSFSSPEYKPLTYPEVFYLATLGGALGEYRSSLLFIYKPTFRFEAL